MIVIALLCAAVLVAAIALAAAVRALVRECRAEAAAERQDATDPLVKAALAVHADEAEDDPWWLEHGEQRLPAALAVAHVAGACAETSCDLWAGWPSGAFRAADAALASGWVPGGPVPLPCGDLAERMRQRLDERAEQAP